MTWKQSEFESWYKKDRVFIVLSWNEAGNPIKGAHYVMIQADGKGTYTTYNLYAKREKEYPKEYLNTDIIDIGSFVCGWYIPEIIY